MRLSLPTKIARLRGKIARDQEILNDMVIELQANCRHEKAEITHRSNDSDGYSQCQCTVWRHMKCPDCGKYWQEVDWEGMGPI